MTSPPGSQKTLPRDDGELLALMEPLILRQELAERIPLQELASELMLKSVELQRSLPPGCSKALARLVRSMNCYYSNLIEGHNTHPVDIERALKSDFSTDSKKRDLQLEACAHIKVQQWIDGGALAGKVACKESLKETHLRFCRELPEELLAVTNPESGEVLRVDPGEFRCHDVKVGVHIAISPGAIGRFLDRFEQIYSKLGKLESCLAVAAMHHRLLWIHPFLDGNGRVARLLSHACLLEAADSQGLWSMARGYAKRVQEYKSLLAHCDEQRRGDLDGRGNLSESALEPILNQKAYFTAHLQVIFDRSSLPKSSKYSSIPPILLSQTRPNLT